MKVRHGAEDRRCDRPIRRCSAQYARVVQSLAHMSSCPINPFGLTALWRAAAGLAGGSAVYSIYSKWPLQALAEGEWLPTVRFGHPRSRANCGNLVPAVLTGSEYYGPSEALTWPRGSTATGHSATERAKAFLQELLQKRRKVPVEVRRLHCGNPTESFAAA